MRYSGRTQRVLCSPQEWVMRCLYALARGVTPLFSAGDLLIPSGSGGPVYRVSVVGCSCQVDRASELDAATKQPRWHREGRRGRMEEAELPL